MADTNANTNAHPHLAPDLRPGAFVAFKPGTPPRERGFYRAVVLDPDASVVEVTRRTARRFLDMGRVNEGVFLDLLAAEAEAQAQAQGTESPRMVLVRTEAAGPAGIDFLVNREWLELIDAAGPAAVN
jgi:hypothetical protein